MIALQYMRYETVRVRQVVGDTTVEFYVKTALVGGRYR